MAAQTRAKPKPKPKKPVAPTTVATPDQQAFLASILADPDDKKARLVYADLLQQTDDPRGAFIVMQCTRADLPDGDPRIPELDAQIDALLARHKKAWTAFGKNTGARWEFRRGFVEKLSLDAKDLVTNAAWIFAAEPVEELNVWKIDKSRVRRDKSRLAPILELPLDRVRRLSLARCKLTQDDLAALASARTLGNVEILDLTGRGSGSVETPLAPLANATSLPKLRELRVSGCMMGDAAMAELAASRTLRFTHLIAPRNDFSEAACESIANATWAPQLVSLDLSSNEMIRDEGLRALAASTQLGALRSLKLEYVGLYEEAADIILGSPVFSKLQHLDVSANMSREDYARLKAVFGDRLK